MSSYWKNYWDKHLSDVSNDDPFRQVMRLQNGAPMSNSEFMAMTSHIINHLKLSDEHDVLDLCCGNGLISAEVAKHCKKVLGIDFSEKLIQDIALRKSDNLVGIAEDVINITLQSESFHRILFAAAIQHFTQAQIIQLFLNCSSWLKADGILLLTDIIDSNLIWKFYDSEEREDAYFDNVLKGTPILGTWFDRSWLIKLARHAGFTDAIALEQPENYPYSHYRFDLLCIK